MTFRDSFLESKYNSNKEYFTNLRATWDINEREFCQKLDGWFSNFLEPDKNLAFKILSVLRYYSKSNFESKLKELFAPVQRYIYQFEIDPSNILVILPENIIDSSVKHAYDLSKIWDIPNKNFVQIEKISSIKISNENILVAFNDTHGSGNQFIYDIWNKISKLKESIEELPVLFIISVTISEKALNYFKYTFKNEKNHIIPQEPEPSALELFTAKEYKRIEELCYEVYPKHYMGFGNTGLLTAYYFQCPNNSLPIIWANGKNNKVNSLDKTGTPWQPLFAYNPKPESKIFDTKKNLKPLIVFTEETNLKFTASELTIINSTLSNWNYNSNNGGKKIGDIPKWFNNFNSKDKDIALKLFKNTKFLTIESVRKIISDLSKKVFKDISDSGSDKSEILLVLTGYEKASVYHHVYDFLKIWNLKVSQVITLEELMKKKYESLNKNLVFFYHTRAGDGNHFINEIWSRINELPVRKHYLLSFVLSENNLLAFKSLKQKYSVECYYDKELSKTVCDIFTPTELKRLKIIINKTTFDDKNDFEKRLLLTYYFVSPRKTLRLLNGENKNWSPLFY